MKDLIITPPAFAFGSLILPGMAKITEEAGEIGQVCGKLLMTGGKACHWQGGDLLQNLCDELADMDAASQFFLKFNLHDEVRYDARLKHKYALFLQWREDQRMGRS